MEHLNTPGQRTVIGSQEGNEIVVYTAGSGDQTPQSRPLEPGEGPDGWSVIDDPGHAWQNQPGDPSEAGHY